MTNEDFFRIATGAGFSRAQAEFLTQFVSRFPHEHTSEQITDWDDAVIDTIEEAEEA